MVLPVSEVILANVRITMDPVNSMNLVGPLTRQVSPGCLPRWTASHRICSVFFRNARELVFENVIITNARGGEILRDDSVEIRGTGL